MQFPKTEKDLYADEKPKIVSGTDLEEGQDLHNEGSGAQKPSQNAQFKQDQEFYRMIKFGKIMMILNLICMVLVCFHCMAFYYLLDLDLEQAPSLMSLILSILADLGTVVEMFLFVYGLVNQHQLVALVCIGANLFSTLLRLIVLLLLQQHESMQDSTALYCLLTLMALLQIIKVGLETHLLKGWKIVPAKKWRKQMILVRKPKGEL